MKKLFFYSLLFLFVISCKKALNISTDKYYEQINWSSSSSAADKSDPGYIGSGPMHLELRTDGRAFLYPGSGDIVWDGSYKIRGKTLTVSFTSMSNSYKFAILSSSEIKGPAGEVLRLKEQ